MSACEGFTAIFSHIPAAQRPARTRIVGGKQPATGDAISEFDNLTTESQPTNKHTHPLFSLHRGIDLLFFPDDANDHVASALVLAAHAGLGP